MEYLDEIPKDKNEDYWILVSSGSYSICVILNRNWEESVKNVDLRVVYLKF